MLAIVVAYMWNRETLYAQTDYNNIHTKIYVSLLLIPHNPVTAPNKPEYITYKYSPTKLTQQNTVQSNTQSTSAIETDDKLNARIAQPNLYKYIKSNTTKKVCLLSIYRSIQT